MTTHAVDTSVAVAAVDPSHVAHESCREVVRARRPALAGHAVFETYSVLTRLPPPLTVEPTTATHVLDEAFPDRCWLTGRHHLDLLSRLAMLGIVGGQVYDALVAEAARRGDCTLLTRDERASRTYDRVGVAYEVLS